MMRLPQAIAAVMGGTMASGLAGGIVGAAVGRFAPSFVSWLHSPGHAPIPGPAFDPTEFGFGLGVVCGLFLGAGSSLFLASVLAIRDAYLLRARVQPPQMARAEVARDEF